ncbi:S1C family serine protease [Nitrospira sp. Kam-Ns4a]
MPMLRSIRSLLLLFPLLAACPDLELQAAPARRAPPETAVQVYKKVAPAIVFIMSAYLTKPHQPASPYSGIGSGVLLDQDGTILTNAHVVAGAAKIIVMLHDNQRMPAEVIGLDAQTDLALLRMALPKNFRAAVQLGDSDQVEIGQEVLAIGHPFGLGYALTTGVVSGFGKTPETGRLFHERVIQTSAPINPGNSGGPLVDLDGRVIGINTAILLGAQNIGFAIPINVAKEIVAELRVNGRVIRPWLGFRGKLLTDEVINLFALPLTSGLIIEDVEPGSPADRIGLHGGDLNVTIEGEPWVLGGDILKAVNGMELRTPEQYRNAFKGLKVGQTVDLSIVRNGARQTVRATLEERPRASATPEEPSSQGQGLRPL